MTNEEVNIFPDASQVLAAMGEQRLPPDAFDIADEARYLELHDDAEMYDRARWAHD